MDNSDRIGVTIDHVMGEWDGHLCVASRDPETLTFHEKYFVMPTEIEKAVKWLARSSKSKDTYFCPQLLRVPKRLKENVAECPSIWADLDGLDPEELLVKPSLVVRTSKGHYHAFWRLAQPADPEEAAAVAKAIAYYHADDGADKSGWDLTQVLRPAGTYNHKYHPPIFVSYTEHGDTKARYTLEDFNVYPAVEMAASTVVPFPEGELPNPEETLHKYRMKLNPRIEDLIRTTPHSRTWSQRLWELEVLLFEAGLSREEGFAIVREAQCNKFARDGRPDTDLWKDIVRAYQYVEERSGPGAPIKEPGDDFPPLLTQEERDSIEPCWVEEYIEWGTSLVDAAPQYHQAGAFMVLSAVLSGMIKLPTMFGVLTPNLWFMILADTTLTRKTTSMDMATDMLWEIDSDAILATDGSIEGLLDGLAARPGRPSVFLRDEIAGLLESMKRRDHYAGMMEMFAKLYDGKYQKRMLRRETIEVRDPILIIFAGGIYDRVLELLQHSHVSSGFIPRFIFLTAESDITRIKPLGPPTNESLERRAQLVERLQEIHDHYEQQGKAGVVDGKIVIPKDWRARLTDEAWIRYNKYDNMMMQAAMSSSNPTLVVPIVSRLAVAGLKTATLIAAVRRLEEEIVVHEQDMIHAFSYVEIWRDHGYQVFKGIGRTFQEVVIQRVLEAVRRKPNGVQRSAIMRQQSLTARDADQIFATLEQRGLIVRDRKGAQERLRLYEGGS